MTNSAHFSKSISDRFHRHVQLSRRCSWREGLWPWSLLDYPQNRGNAGPGGRSAEAVGREKGITVGWQWESVFWGLSRYSGVLHTSRVFPVQLCCDSCPCPIHPSIQPASLANPQHPAERPSLGDVKALNDLCCHFWSFQAALFNSSKVSSLCHYSVAKDVAQCRKQQRRERRRQGQLAR